MKDKTLAELLVELEHSTINYKSTIHYISWAQVVELKDFLSDCSNSYYSIHAHLGEEDTFSFTYYTAGI